jgi:hypothetical protein
MGRSTPRKTKRTKRKSKNPTYDQLKDVILLLMKIEGHLFSLLIDKNLFKLPTK